MMRAFTIEHGWAVTDDDGFYTEFNTGSELVDRINAINYAKPLPDPEIRLLSDRKTRLAEPFMTTPVSGRQWVCVGSDGRQVPQPDMVTAINYTRINKGVS